MSRAKINLRQANGPGGNWNDLGFNGSNSNLNDFDTGLGLGWSAAYTANASDALSATGSTGPYTGDADWMHPDARDGHYSSSTSVWSAVTISNLSDVLHNIRCMSSASFAGRITAWRVNGGTLQELANHDGTGAQDTNDVRFLGVSPVAGEIVIEYRRADSSGGSAYANAIYIEDVPGPSLTVTQTELTPGGTISGSYSNYATVPTTLTVSDGTNTITIANPTISDNGDGTGTFSGTMPSLPDLLVFDANTNYQVGDKFQYEGVIYEVTATQAQPNATPPNAAFYATASGPTASLILFGNVTVELS